MSLPPRVLRGAVWFLIVLSVIGTCGSLVPREHIVMQTAELPAPPAAVHAVIRDVASAPSWRSGLGRVEVLPPQGDRPRYREFGDHGAMTLEIVQDVPGERLVTQIVDLDLGFTGKWVFELTPTETGTRLTLSEIGDVPNPFFRFFAHYLFGFEGAIDQYLADLRARIGKAA